MPISDMQNLEESKFDYRMHEMEELRRVQELRVDEFCAQILKESHDTIQRLTSQIQELQERANCMSDSGEFQEKESNYSGQFSLVPSQPAVVQVLDLC